MLTTVSSVIKDTPRYSLDSRRANNNDEASTSPSLKYSRRHSRSSSLSSLDKYKRQEQKKSSRKNTAESRKGDDISLERKDKEDKLSKASIKSDKSSLSVDSHEPLASTSEIEIISGNERPGSFAALCEFQLANEKQNDIFHALFKSVPQTDVLIEVYKCALQKEILLQGHIYISEHHVCFKANIFGWVTNLVINFDEITAVEKRMTAKVIPNGIMIATSTSRHIFASFLLRDQAYDQIVKIWKLHKRISSLSSSSSLNTSSSITQSYEESKHDQASSSNRSSTHSKDSAIMPNTPPHLLTDETLIKEDIVSQPSVTTYDNKPMGTTLLKIKDTPLKLSTTSNNRPRSVSDSYATKMTSSPIVIPPKPSEHNRKQRGESHQSLVSRFSTGKAVTCPCMQHNEQYGYVALDRVYPGTVEAVDKLLFETDFIKRFLERYENFEDVQVERWKNNSRNITGKRRIKASEKHIKMIKTLFHEKREQFQLPYYSCVTAKKSMPDMPMGAVYCIQCRTCITRVSKQKVRVLITFEVAFKKSGLISSVIENNAADDQFRQYNHLASVLANPGLAKELIKDKELLTILRLAPKRSLKNPASWLDYNVQLNVLVYIAFFLVILSQLVLITRVYHVHDQFQQLERYLKTGESYNKQRVTGSLDINLSMVYDRLDVLKGKIKEYDEHLMFLKNNVK
ncbi:hypothetical protein G6F46_007071 [Rhizopus delemar]|uniref:VASt domain-containing protein n=2 Tax=Rhizopus TaxID=4842 RepID=A0A9P7CNR8_9FUNG|nr:hypothetical protein G6F55_005676 [Rhizopus delemar]KAG1542524.1 hypothetical protein G6F51_007217 [Rhizopus arrhizus]KAG1496491.1 hypothetical protein G6F54_006439 [Rhizopus delemar]KAG1510256.1 hypothetical protein G6F53_006823 [Rhizopus delemar]KAG1523284.1 hypothetical protein G6F52_005150 [Rhizopus delemar]